VNPGMYLQPCAALGCGTSNSTTQQRTQPPVGIIRGCHMRQCVACLRAHITCTLFKTVTDARNVPEHNSDAQQNALKPPHPPTCTHSSPHISLKCQGCDTVATDFPCPLPPEVGAPACAAYCVPCMQLVCMRMPAGSGRHAVIDRAVRGSGASPRYDTPHVGASPGAAPTGSSS
jgi:hypothetical protein